MENGLRPKEELQYSPSFLSSCSNIYLGEGGIFEAEKFSRTFNIDEDAQVFATYIGVYVLTQSKLYSYADTLTQLLTGLTTGGLWSCADFGKLVLFANGSVNLIRNVTSGAFATDPGTTFPLSKAICNHRGRLIIGGMTDYPETGSFTNWIAWSDIGNLKFVKTTELDQIRKNLSGYMPMPWNGTVLKVVPLIDKVIVYGDNGITALQLYGGSTYGQVPVHPIGILDQGAVCFNSPQAETATTHYFIDKTGWLYAMGADLKPQKLGYKEFLNV